jgi:NAD(P)-dependent dehydrogenase (short-subunit alcohol dehydrogenase family)
VTGGYTGIGYELCQILHAHNATIYIAGRSKQKASDAIIKLQSSSPNSRGSLKFLQMDFNDLATVKSGVQIFLSEQDRLHVLVNNAGVSTILLLYSKHESLRTDSYMLLHRSCSKAAKNHVTTRFTWKRTVLRLVFFIDYSCRHLPRRLRLRPQVQCALSGRHRSPSTWRRQSPGAWRSTTLASQKTRMK